MPPEKFNAKSVTRELGKMNKKFNLAKCDLVLLWDSIFYSFSNFYLTFDDDYNYFDFFFFQLHFPVVSDKHWTITSINLLFKKINFLDSLQDTDKEKKAIMASNIVPVFILYFSFPLIIVNVVSISSFSYIMYSE